MIRIFDIASKDILQLLRDRKIFLFMLVMPIAFTLLFGYAFGGFDRGTSDSRLPVGYLDLDQSWLSRDFHEILLVSEVIRLHEITDHRWEDLREMVAQGDMAAAIIVPPGYGHAMLAGKLTKLILVVDTTTSVSTTVKSAIMSAANRLDCAIRTAIIMERLTGGHAPCDYIFDEAISAWQQSPIRVSETSSLAISPADQNSPLAHTSPGMMLQFAIAGLLTSAQIIVSERNSRALQRMLTTATSRVCILLGHYLAIFMVTFSQFLLLITFGQLILKVNYLRDPAATILMAFATALCIAALGLLIGVLAKSDEQAVVFSLITMFVFAGLGGAWVPLEITGTTFQIIGHVSPLAWAMDGFKNVSVRGLGFEAALFPAGALLIYTLLLFSLATWRFQIMQEH